jgi:HSP20 family protein
MDPKDIDISMNNGFLTIKGEKKHEREEKDENYHLVERSYGSFTRSVRLPREVQSDKVIASFKNGVLRVTLPKSEEAKKKEIKIKVE